MLYTIHDFSSWRIVDRPISGSSEKFWLEKDKKRGLFKFTREDYSDFWVEKMASDIFNYLGLKSMRTDIGIYNDKLGSMCYDFTLEYGAFFEIDDKLVGFSRKEGTYTLEMLKSIVSLSTFKDIIYMLMIDFLIGNYDRHTGNFGILKDGSLAPIYDSGSSLSYRLQLNDIQLLYKDKNKLLSSIYHRPQSRCLKNEFKVYSNFELMKILQRDYSSLFISSMHRLSVLTEEALDKILLRFILIRDEEFLNFIHYVIFHRFKTLKGLI